MKRIDIRLKFFDLKIGDIEWEFGYNLVLLCFILEIVCDLILISGYLLFNVFVCLEDFWSCVFVFLCFVLDLVDYEEVFCKEIEVKLDKCNCKSNCNFYWGVSVSFMRVFFLWNSCYWLGVIFNDGEFILLEMVVKLLSLDLVYC